MKEKINEFLKEQEYSKGQLYKIRPDQLLNDFIEFINSKKKKSIRQYISEQINKSTIKGYENIKK